ncbi:MAG: TonB-dependent receptor [Saprospiraceae bacterium]|nr:TonB-dependent receptor [Saprospiraceae bacterium]
MNIAFKILFFTVFSISLLGAQSQPDKGPHADEPEKTKGMIIGQVIDQTTQTPLEFATISVLSKMDSSIVTGGISELDGKFGVEVEYGEYIIKLEFISYEKLFIDNVVVDKEHKLVDLGEIQISPAAEVLQEVQVIAEKSEVQFDLDKRTFNIGKDLANKGGSAEDILDNIPSVSVDVEGNVSLRGSENVQILVDGKPSGLVGLGDAAGLKSLPANMIEKVELVTNASARYDAEGTSGIINIVLKKDKKQGFNGAVDVSAGLPESYGLGLTMNVRKNWINYFLNYGIRHRTGPGKGYTLQEFYGNVPIPFTEQFRTNNRGGLSNSFRGGMDLFISPKDVITGAFTYRIGDDYSDALTKFYDYDLSRTLIGISERSQDETEDEDDLEYDLNYERKFDKEGQKLTAQLQYRNNTETEAADFTEKPFDANYVPTGGEDLLQRSRNTESHGYTLIQADYVHPFSKDNRLEVGFKATFGRIGNDYLVEEYGDDGWRNLENLSNNFNYEEDIVAGYLIYGNKIDKWSYQVGLRAEQSHVLTELLQTNEINDRSYGNLFPSGHLNYEINKGNSLQWSYSRRISRPRFWYLNPFFTFSNNRNIWGGNPNLNPEFTDSYEMGYLKYWSAVTLGTSLYYRHTTGVIERISRVDGEGITRTQPENLSTENAFGVELTTSADINKWWRVDFSANIYSEKVRGQLGDLVLASDAFTYRNRLNSKMKFWKDAEFQLRFDYRAPQNTTQGRRKSMSGVDIGFSKDVMEKKGTITFNMRDLFNTRKWRYETFGDDFYMEGFHQRRPRQMSLSFNYRINQKKQRQRSDRGDGGGDGDFGEF